MKRSTIEKFTIGVLATRKGVDEGRGDVGDELLSDSWIAVNPRTDEPSNMRPFSRRPR